MTSGANSEQRLEVALARLTTELQQSEGELRGAADDGFDIVLANEMLVEVVKAMLDDTAKLLHVVGSRGVDDRDGLREVVVVVGVVFVHFALEFLDG